MSYMERLKAKISETPYTGSLTKPTKPSCVSFDSDQSRHVLRDEASIDEIAAGLQRLETMPTPLIAQPSIWPAIVSDALHVDREGWGKRALALGWDPLELWGCVPGDPYGDGLAVWLRGERIVLLDADSAIAVAGSWRRVFHRPGAPGAIYLWSL